MKTIKLSEVCDVRDGTHDSPKYVIEGYPLITSKNIIDGKIDFSNVNYISEEDYIAINNRSNVDDGDILMPMIGTIGKPIIVNKEFGFAIKNVALIKFYSDSKVIPIYIKYLLDSNLFKQYVEKENRGGTQKFLSLGNIRSFQFYLISLEQQNEITTILNKLSQIIVSRKEQIKLLDDLIKSRFVEMFGDPVKNEKRWEINNLGDLGYFKNGMNFNQSDEGYILKFLGVGEFKKLTRIDSVSILSELELSNKPSDEYLLQKGDIVFVRSNGSKELVGRSVLIGELEEPATYSGFCIRFRNQNQKIQPDFLIRLFADDNFKKTFKQDSRGANINNLNQTMLSGLRIIVPPIELQNRFTAFVQVTDKLKFEV